MQQKTRLLVAAVLTLLTVALAALVWIQTKALVVTLLLLVACAAALYFVVRKR